MSSNVKRIRAGTATEIPVGDMTVFKDGELEILLIHLDSGIHAMNNKCIHGSCSLLHGIIEGANIRCRCHYSLFDIKTGARLDGPATTPQPVYTVSVENNEIFVSLE